MVMERVVMPVLDEFQPELIINSAGQDNHYSDPITSMNFTAQGYARLNRLLNPDICVLEGGYAIEGALPYTNLGIILAMAGMDFTHVREPDYDPSRFIQPPEMNRYIEAICGKALEVFSLRNRKKNASLHKGTVATHKQIFYDTTGFHVEETKIFHLCPECPGFTEIKATGLRNHIHAFTVPFNACPKCQGRAKDGFILTKTAPQTVIALQDRIGNIYETK
jgi:hypothetical protein